MSNQSYHIAIPVISLILLSAILVHITTHGKLEDKSSRLFRKLLLLSMLDILFDVISIVVPLIPGLHLPFLFNLLNGIYFQLNAYMLYTMFYYFNNLREPKAELGKVVNTLAVIPGILSGILLAANLFFHVVFWYDENNIYHQGIFYYFIYLLAFLYLIASMVLIRLHIRQYSVRKRQFLSRTIGILLFCILFQLIWPEYLTIDLGISLSVLLFYLYNNNPVQYVDFLTGALDKSYFDVWFSEQIQMEREIFLIAIRMDNLSDLTLMHGEKLADSMVTVLAEAVRKFDHEHSVFRLSGNCFLIHNHDFEGFEQKYAEIGAWTESEECARLLPGCRLSLAGIPHAEKLTQHQLILSYTDYLFAQAKNNDSSSIISNEMYISGFRYNMEVERYVSEAVEKDLFDLAFQPIYHLKKQSFSTVEVLTRLSHPVFGYLSPLQVITYAEQNGLIDRVTELQVCRLCRYLQSQPELLETVERFKFNLSPINLMRSEFIQRLAQRIGEHGLPLNKFEFEITEATVTEITPEIVQILAFLQENDITLTLDDFGSGYSNLSTMLSLPFHSIKLDRSLILQVFASERVARFYEGIVHIMQEYGMEIVCEGVETREGVDLLHSWGADMIQGYYYSKPISGQQLVEFLRKKD